MFFNWLARRVAGVLKWTPIGGGAHLRSIEGLLSREVKQIDGTIAGLQQLAGYAGTALVFSPRKTSAIEDEALVLIPRHTGYDYQSLIFTGIAVYVFRKRDTEQGVPAQEKMLAVATLTR